jgi:hypothetical protein
VKTAREAAASQVALQALTVERLEREAKEWEAQFEARVSVATRQLIAKSQRAEAEAERLAKHGVSPALKERLQMESAEAHQHELDALKAQHAEETAATRAFHEQQHADLKTDADRLSRELAETRRSHETEMARLMTHHAPQKSVPSEASGTESLAAGGLAEAELLLLRRRLSEADATLAAERARVLELECELDEERDQTDRAVVAANQAMERADAAAERADAAESNLDAAMELDDMGGNSRARPGAAAAQALSPAGSIPIAPSASLASAAFSARPAGIHQIELTETPPPPVLGGNHGGESGLGRGVAAAVGEPPEVSTPLADSGGFSVWQRLGTADGGAGVSSPGPPDGQSQNPPQQRKDDTRRVVALQSFAASAPEDLALQEGDVVVLTKAPKAKQWWKGYIEGPQGEMLQRGAWLLSLPCSTTWSVRHCSSLPDHM